MLLQRCVFFILFIFTFALAIMIVEKCKPTKTGGNGKLCGGLAYTIQSQNLK